MLLKLLRVSVLVLVRGAWLLAPGLAGATDTAAAEPAPAPASVAQLAQQVENPLAKVISLRLSENVNLHKGEYERTQSVTSFNATYPFDLPDRWNLFATALLPVISQPVGDSNRTFGLGDLTLTALVSPPSTSRWVYGFGPAVVAPTATDGELGLGKWELGPAVAVVYTRREWVAGVVALQSWSISGANDRPDVSRLVISPFTTWYINKGWYLFSAPALSADWNDRGKGSWTVPLGGGLGHIVRHGRHAINIVFQGYANVIRREGDPDWQFRISSGWLFPK